MAKLIFSLVGLFTSALLLAQPCTSTSTRVGGVVFNDANENGVLNTTETKQTGITVSVYNNAGTLVGTDVSDSNGDWYVDVPITPSVNVPYRVEFSIPSSYLLTGMQPAVNGTGSKSDVQFITASGCTISFGVNYVSDYCNANPDLLLACFVTGDPLPATSTIRNEAAIVKIPYGVTNGTTANPSPTAPVYVSATKDVASVFGAAYQRETKKLFTAAFLKRHVGLGTGGLGGVYVTDAGSGTVNGALYFDLENFGYNLGQSTIATRSIPASGTAASPDPTTFDAVGKIGLGGMDISEDGSKLYITDLFNKQLFVVNIGNPAKATITAADVTTVAIPAATCTNGVARPFALTYHKGKVYSGQVCTGENAGGTVANVSSSVYVYDPLSNTFGGTAILTQSMNYTKGAVHTTNNWLPYWRPWISTFASLSTNGTVSSNPVTTRAGLPQPMFSDIAFTDNGDMVLGFMDRAGHQLGYKQVATDGTGNYSGYIGGDLLRATYNGTAWVMESNGAVGSVTSAGGVGNGQGPGGGEFYNNENYLTTHSETFMGSMGIFPGTNELLATVMDPLNTWTAGFRWFNNTNGTTNKNYQIYATQTTAGAATYGKANGLGALRAACAAAPIEIGNYVWIDIDKDGLQDPSEMPLANVTVKLYKLVSGVSTLVASTTTNASGNYYFRDYQEYGIGFDTLAPNTQYLVVLGENGQWSTANRQLSIGGTDYILTSQNAGTTTDQNDNDAYVFTTAGQPFTNYPVDTVTIPSAGGGYVNHTLDFGLIICPNITNPSVAQSLCAGTVAGTLSVQTNQNTANGIRFVRFSSDPIAGATPTAMELTTLYTTGTVLGTVTPTGGTSPYTATYTPTVADFPNATASNLTYYVYAILNPDLGSDCRPIQEIVITVKPTPTITINPTSQTVCNNAMTTAVAFTGTVVGSTYSWTNSQTNIGLAANGTGNIAAFTATNTGSTAVTANLSVTASANGCSSAASNFTITVNPTPSVTLPANQILCNGTTTAAVNFTGSAVSGTTYAWTNNQTSIGLAASGSGNIAAFTATNTGSTAVVSTITVTPTANACAGTSRNFTITVRPTPSVSDPADQAVCHGTNTAAINFSGSAVTGTTYGWTNNTTSIGLGASATGNIPAFSAINNTASPVVATLTVTPIANTCQGTAQTFTITVNPAVVFSSSKTDPSVCGATDGTISLTGLANNTTYTVNYTLNGTPVSSSMTSNGAGVIAINNLNAGVYTDLTVLANGCTSTPPISMTLTDPSAPTADLIPHITVCPSGSVPAINFTGTGSPTFNWTNNNTGIGLAASGTGNIGAFTATNVSTQQIALITVTPSNGGCVGAAVSFTITVVKPTIDDPADMAVCASSTIGAVLFTGTGTSFNWTNNNTNTGLAASGTGNIAAFTAPSVLAQEISTITVTPIQSGCSGSPQTFTLTINPLPTAVAPTNAFACSGATSAAISLSGTASAAFSWTNNNTTTGLVASGTGTIPSFVAQNVTSDAVSMITITPILNGCTGSTQTFSITVRPLPEVTAPNDIIACASSNVAVPAFVGTMGATFNWSNNNTAAGLAASGVGNIANFTAASVVAQQVSVVTITTTLNGCSGVPKAFNLSVNPLPIFSITTSNPTTCGGSDGSITLSGLLPNTTYVVSYAVGGTGTISPFISNAAGVILIENLGEGAYSGIIGSLNGCSSVAQSATLSDPVPPSVMAMSNQVVCSGGAVAAVAFTGTAGATFNWTNNNTAIGLGATGLSTVQGFNAAQVPTDQTATITVTPTLNGCFGTSRTFTIMVRAQAVMNAVADVAYCTTDAVSAIGFSSTPMGASFNWTNDNTNTGLAASGTGTIGAFTAASVTASQQSHVTVTPTLNGCVGTPSVFRLDVNPFVSAGTAAAATNSCLEGSGLTVIDLDSKLTGVNTNGIWTDISTVSAGAKFHAPEAVLDPNGLPVGTYTFRFTVTGVAPCPSDSEDVVVIVSACCKPVVCSPVTVMRN